MPRAAPPRAPHQSRPVWSARTTHARIAGSHATVSTNVQWLKCAIMKPEKTKAIDAAMDGNRSTPRTRAYA